MMRIVLILTCVLCLFNSKAASAWGYQGHEVVGSIADQLLHDNAKQHVRDILNFTTPELRIAAPWADCVRSVVADSDGFEYVVNPEHFEYEVPCRPFKSPEARARMEDFAKRNWFNCKPAACHINYHFANVAIERDRYDRKYRGTNDHDLFRRPARQSRC